MPAWKLNMPVNKSAYKIQNKIPVSFWEMSAGSVLWMYHELVDTALTCCSFLGFLKWTHNIKGSLVLTSLDLDEDVMSFTEVVLNNHC